LSERIALNVALPDYEVDRVATAFVGELSWQIRCHVAQFLSAAQAANFKLFFSFDMSFPWAASDM
jgi:hypothetical protein